VPSIFYYLASRVDPKKPHTTGKKYKPAIAIGCKDVVKSWIKRLMKNINRLQIEIYGLKRVARYSAFRRCLVENAILKSMRYEKQSVI